MEAGSGIEPLYEDLQDGTHLGFPRVPGRRVASVLHRALTVWLLTPIPGGEAPLSSGCTTANTSTPPKASTCLAVLAILAEV